VADKKKISFATKYISNEYLLNEVSVEGKKSRKLNFRLGNFRYLDDCHLAIVTDIGAGLVFPILVFVNICRETREMFRRNF
jgi:hypothetical protein